MKYTRSAITQLSKWYKQVLIRCAKYNAAVLVGVVVAATGASATVTPDFTNRVLTIDRQTGRVSSFALDELEDFQTLIIRNNSDVNFDKPALFISDKNDQRHYLLETDSSYPKYKEFTDQIEYDDDDEEDGTVHSYENQIYGQMTFDNSRLTLQSNMAADVFEVTNGATLSATDYIIGGRTLNVNQNSTVSLGATYLKFMNSGFDENVTVNNGSTLNIQRLTVGDCSMYGCPQGRLQILNNSNFNVTNGELTGNTLKVQDSSMSLNNSRMRLILNDSSNTIDLSNADVSLNNYSYVFEDGITSIASSDVDVKNHSTLSGVTMNITNDSEITAEDSHVGAFKRAVKVDHEDKDISLKLGNGTFLPEDFGGMYDWQSDLNISNSIVHLKGASELGTGFAIVEYDNHLTSAEYTEEEKITGYITQEMANNQQVLFNKYRGYDRYDFSNSLAFTEDYKSAVNISGSNITMEGTSSIVNAMVNVQGTSGDIKITNGSTLLVKGNNTLNATGNVNISYSTVRVQNGATLNAISLDDDDYGDHTIRVEGTTVDVNGAVTANIVDDWENDSTLQLMGSNASISGNALGLAQISFSNVDNSLSNQTLEAKGLLFSASMLDLLGGVSLTALENGIQFKDNSIISVRGGQNSIEALNQDVLLQNSDIDIYKNAVLNLNVGDNGEVQFDNGYIRVEGTLTGNARVKEIVISEGGIVDGTITVNNVNYDHQTETVATKYEDVDNLNIKNGSNITIKNADTFKITDEKAKRPYTTGTYQGKTYYDDAGDGEIDEDDVVKSYENQIYGTLTVNGGSTLNLQSNLAAKDVNINNATLNAVDYIMGGDTLTLSNGATVDLTGKKRLVNSNFNKSLSVTGGSMLKANYLSTGIDTDGWDWNDWEAYQDYVPSTFTVSRNSLFQASNGEVYSEMIHIDGSALNLSNVRFKSEGIKDHELRLTNATVQSDRSFIQSDGEVFVEGNSTNIVLDNHSTLTAEKTTIDGGQIVANNSDVGGFMHAIKIEDDDKKIKNRMANYYGQPPMGLDVSNSSITLQGTSNLGVGLAIVKWPVSYTGTIVGFVTDDLIENPNTLINQYRGYEVENFEDGNLERARDYRSTLNISGSSVSMEGTSSLINAMINTEDDSGDINITSSTIWAKGNNNLKASGDINIEDSTLTVQNGATLNVNSSDDQEYDDKTIYVSNTNVSVSGKLNATLVDDSNNDSTLTLSGKGASITGSVIGLDSIVLNSVENVLSDQTLEANSLDFKNAKLKLLGGVSLIALENGINLQNDSLIMVYGKGNTIEAINQTVLLDNSNINIYKNATLNLNVGDNGWVKFDNGEIRVAGTLTGNAEAQHIVLTQGGIIENARINDLDIDNSGKKNMSDIVTGVAEDVDNLNIINGSDVTLDKDGIFVVSSDHRIYETGSDGGKTYYIDQTDVEPPSPYEHDDIRDYDNQIVGDLTIDETSKLTLNSNFAANNITVDGGTLNSTDHLLGGKSLVLDNGAKVNLLSSRAIVENGFDDEVTVRGGSKLNVSLLQVGQDDETGENSRLNVSEGSTFTVSNGNVYAGKINIEDSTLNVTKARFKSEGAELTLNNTAFNADAGFVQSDGDLEVENSNNVKLRNQSSLIGSDVYINNSTITADNSVVGAFTNAIKADKASKELDNRLSHNGSEPRYMSFYMENSNITLNGNSMLGTGLAITEWSNVDLGTGSVTGYLTKEMADDSSILFNKYQGYQDAYNDKTGQPTFDPNGRIDQAYDYKSSVDIARSQILMNGTSSIVNAVLNTTNSGNIYIANSDITSKGTNNLISAAADVVMQHSTLNVEKGATLKVLSSSPMEYYNNTLHVRGSNIVLGGTLNANLQIDDQTNLRLKGGRVEGTVRGLSTLDLSETNGSTSSILKGTIFENLGDLNISSTIDDKGKKTTSKITIDSSIFTLAWSGNWQYYLYDHDEDEYIHYGFEKPEDFDDCNVTVYTYDNQISGNVNISDGATLTLNKALAAENFNIDGATFVSNNALFSGNLNLDNKATATINGSKLDLSLGNIELNGDSTLNLNSIEWLSANNLSSNASTLNTNKWTELSLSNINLQDTKTTVSAGGAWISAENANISGGSFNVADADIGFVNTQLANVDVKASNRTLFAVNDMTVSGGSITLNDTSKMVTGFASELYAGPYVPGRSDMTFEDEATLNLNGSGTLALAVVEQQESESGRDKDVGYLDYELDGMITFNNASVNMSGTAGILNRAENSNVTFENGALLNVKGKENSIKTTGLVTMADSTLNIDKGATLKVLSSSLLEDYHNTLHVVRSNIVLGGVLNANLSIEDEEDDATSLTMNGGRVSGRIIGLNNVGLGAGQSGKTSATLKGTSFENIKGLTIAGEMMPSGRYNAPNIVLDSSVFKLSDGHENIRYYGYNREDGYFIDCGTREPDIIQDWLDIDVVYTYDNQILGDVNISDGATLTLNKALAAENFNIDGATLVSNNALFSGNLNLDNKATATINGTKLDLTLADIELNGGSTLNLNSVEYIDANNLSSNASTVNFNNWTELGLTGTLSLIDTKTTISSSGWISAENANISGGSLNVSSADITILESTNIEEVDATISKNTDFSVNALTVSDGTLTLNDTSKIITGYEYIYEGWDGVEPSDNVRFDSDRSDMTFEYGATLNLNGSSVLALAVVKKQATDSGRDKDVGYSNYIIDGDISFMHHSKVNMTGSSSILNRANDGDIYFGYGSALNAKGKNNTITTTGNIYVNDSTLDVAQGAVLTVNTSDDYIYLNNARVKLSGILNANLDGTIDTMIFGANGNVSGRQHITGTINSFGVSGVNTKGLDNLLSRFRSDNMVTFEMTDNSNLNFDDDLVSKLSFDNLNVEASTLTISGDRELEGRLTADLGSTIKINNGTAFAAEAVYMADTALTVSGAALRRGETNYQTSLSTENGMHIDNTNNGKAAVSISNVEVGGDLFLNNVTKATLTNICAYDSFVNVSGDVIKDSKGNNSYKTATLTNVGGDVLNVDDAKVILQKSNVFENINASGEGYVDIKDSLTTDLSLEDKATAVLAAGKTLNGSVVLNDESTLSVQGTLQSNVQGEGLLNISNSKAKVMGDVDGVELGLSKMKGKISDIFKGDVENVMGARLASATMTLDKLNNFGDVKMEKSTITLTGNVSTSQLTMNGSTLNLGTNVFHVSGDAALTNKSTINLDVDSKTKYGQLNVDGSLLLDRDAKGNPTTNLAVTLKKGIALSKNDAFQFLNYGDVEGKLNKVTIKNNRYTFYEQEIGQFVITEAISGKAVVDRSNPALRNAMRTAAAFVDNSQSLGSDQQNNLAEGLNALSQVVGGEETYIQALNATNPDDNNMVSENTVNTVNTVLSAAADRISSGGISSSAQGMSSGDVSNAAALWTKVLYNHGKLDSASVHDGFKSRNRGLAMGADKLVKDYLKLGLGYAFTKGKVTNAYRKSDVKTHTAMVYGEYKPSYWFVNGLASYGWSDYDSKAYSAIGVTKSDFDVTAAAIQLNTGYDVNMTSNTILTPVLGMRYMHITKDGYTDSDGKHIAKNNSNIVTALASAKLKTTFESGNGTYITPEARLGVTYDIKRDADNSVVKLANGTSYVVEGRTLNRFALEAGLGVTAAFENGIEVSAGYEGRFRKDYRDHTGLINIKYNF